MPNYDFKCKCCGNTEEINCSFDEIKDMEKDLTCQCGGKFKKIWTSTISIIGTNRWIDKPGLDPEQSKLRAAKSLQERKHKRLNKGGIL